MFVTQNQVFYFFESVCLGVFTAFLYQPLKGVKFIVKNAVFRHIADFLFVFIVFYIYMLGSKIFYFPNFRIYLYLGEIIGFCLCEISFGKTLAKISFFVYNKTISFIRRLYGDGRKKKKTCRRKYRNVGDTAIRFGNCFGVSSGVDERKEKFKR